MKIWKTITYLSVGIVLLVIAVIISAPLRFPGATIAWQAAMWVLLPAIILTSLLALGMMLSSATVQKIILAVGAISVIIAVLRYVLPVAEVIFLICLAIMYIVLSKIKQPQDMVK